MFAVGGFIGWSVGILVKCSEVGDDTANCWYVRFFDSTINDFENYGMLTVESVVKV